MSDPVTTGFRFKEGKLYIFEPGGVMVLHAWPELKALRKAPRDPEWRRFAPKFPVVRPYRRSARDSKQPQLTLELGAIPATPSLLELRRRAFDSFRFTIPKPVAALVERFQNMQWRVLKLIETESRAMEVCASNPALVFCLANAKPILGRRGTIREVARLILRRQRNLMPCLGMDPTDSNAKTLGKVLPESLSAQTMRALVDLLKVEGTRKSLNHLRKINAGVIALLMDPSLRPVCTSSLLEEVSRTRAEHYRGITAQKLADIQRMKELMELPFGAHRYSSRRAVDTDHARLSLEFSRVHMLKATGIRFGRPPIPGTMNIIPLRTPADLAAEGRLQGNCVGSYADRVQTGRCYIYRVSKPERATLSLVQDGCGHWGIEQLLASHNRQVQPKTLEAVSEWLGQYSICA